MAATIYPLDTSGTASTNLISNEVHSVQPPSNTSQASFIIPRAAPFFLPSLEIFTGPNRSGSKLVVGVDYTIIYDFVAGTNYLGRALAGGVLFTNALYSGNVYLYYQTLGGDFTIDDTIRLEQLARKLYSDVRFTTWDQLDGVPSALPPDAHQHPVTDIKTLADVVTELQTIANVLIGSVTGSSSGDGAAALALVRQHLNATSNAHTASAVGLGSLSNYPVATQEEAAAGRSDRYMTPALTAYMVRRIINGEDIDDVRTKIDNMQSSIDSIKTTLTQYSQTIANLNQSLSSLNTSVTLYRQEITTLSQQITAALDQAALANTVAAQAVTQSVATDINLQQLATNVNNTIYSNSIILPAGGHFINLAAGTSMLFTLIGGGGGSGRYYTLSSDQVVVSGGPTSGEDSVLYFIGNRNTPIEPVPLLVAGGGLAGANSYGSIGSVNGGNGGVSYRFRTERVKVSEITNINLNNDLIRGDNTTTGVNGTAGDTSNTQAFLTGVGGYTVNASADNYHQTYGRGCRGVTRAGLGGGGGKWSITIQNDSASTVRLYIVVGRAGRSARGAVNDEITNIVEKIVSSGVAVVTLVT